MALRRTMLLAAALCGLAASQTTGLTTIQDTLYEADGTRYNGTLMISWSTFDATNIGTIVQQSKNVDVVNGNLLVQLAPDATAPPPANIYKVLYQSDGRSQFTETWAVPVSSKPLTVRAVRVTSQTTTGTGGGGTPTGGGLTGGATTIPESSVVGLQADLAQRPLKGAGFGTNAVAVVDDSGNIETAVGDIGSCVFVDGTTGQCTPPTYSDAETPAGTLDGMNGTFTLANTPLGSSLTLFRNGLYMTANLDYTLTGSTIQFVPGAIPQPGDLLAAFYRVDTSATGNVSSFSTLGSTNQLRTSSAQVICSAAGTSVTATIWTTLGGCDLPVAGLQPGDRIEIRFTFAHTGTAAGFSFQVNWGNTTILARSGVAQDAAVAGRAEAAVTASGAEISIESWGTVMPFLPGILNAPAQAGLEITLQAAMSQGGGDSVALTNYTVIRYPGN